MDAIKEYEAKQRANFEKNKNKIIEKLTIEYLQKHFFIPIKQVNDNFVNLDNEFERFSKDYFIKFPSGTILDALWAFDSNLLPLLGNGSLSKNDYFMSMHYLKMSQCYICEIEGKIEQALYLNFEATCYLTLGRIYGSALNLDKYSKNHDFSKAFKITADSMLTSKDEMRWHVSNKFIERIAKKTGTTLFELLADYHFKGSIPNSDLSSDLLNKAYILGTTC